MLGFRLLILLTGLAVLVYGQGNPFQAGFQTFAEKFKMAMPPGFGCTDPKPTPEYQKAFKDCQTELTGDNATLTCQRLCMWTKLKFISMTSEPDPVQVKLVYTALYSDDKKQGQTLSEYFVSCYSDLLMVSWSYRSKCKDVMEFEQCYFDKQKNGTCPNVGNGTIII